jgi:hypothetical protein
MAEGSEVPVEFYFAAGLTVLGHLCKTDLTIANDLEIRPQLYTALLGTSGEVKKSTARKKTQQFFTKAIADYIAFFDTKTLYGVGSGEGLARELEDIKDILLTYDELRAFMDKSSSQGSVLLPMVTQLFEETNYDNPTKAKPCTVRDAHLSMLGCCTTETYEKMWSPAAIAIGLPNRLFVIHAEPQRRVAWPKKKDPEVMKGLMEMIRGQLHRLPKEFDISDQARGMWEDWYLHRKPHGVHSTRLDTIGFKLMGLLALSWDKDIIDEEVIGVVIRLLDYEYQVRVLTDPIDADSKVGAMEQKIRNILTVAKKWVFHRDLQQRTHANRGLWFFKTALRNLIEDGFIEQDREGKTWKYRMIPDSVATPVATGQNADNP